MQEHHSTSPTVTRIVTVLAILSLIGFAAFGVFFLWMYYAPVDWDEEYFQFESGSSCYVFREPRLILFIGDDGPEEVFTSIGGYGNGKFNANGFRNSGWHGSDLAKVFSYEGKGGIITMKFHDGKGEMVVSHCGTKLTLNDGREFTLDGRTPLWLRCKSDGTIVELEELPEGFVEFFESPPAEPGLIGSVKSWPEAFRK